MSKFFFSRWHLQEPRPKACFIKDAVHKEIDFSEDQFWLYELVNTWEFQRLFKLRQLSLTWMNFPSSSHTRLIHSLGVYEICNKFIAHLLAQGDLVKSKDQKEINVALAYALLHDIGHGPLSHTFEKLFPEFNHEEMGFRVISSEKTKINALLRKKAISDGLDECFYIEEIGKVFNKESSCQWIMDMVASDIDIDRLDFLVRDSYYSGVSYGNAIDLVLLTKWSVIREDEKGIKRFSFLKKAKNHLDQFLSCREKMYVDLYFNDVTTTYENILKKILDYIRRNKNEFIGNDKFKPISFLFEPIQNWDIEDYLSLYDDNFLQAICDLLENSNDELKKLRGYLFGFNNVDNSHEFIKEYRVDTVPKKSERVKLKLWDPDEKSFVEVNILDK